MNRGAIGGEEIRLMPIVLGTVAAIGFEDFPPRDWLSCFRELGCQVVQAYRNSSAPVSVQQMRDAIAEGGMPCDSLHGIFGEAFDPSAPQEEARRFAVDTFKSEGEVALALGGRLVVAHCSTIRRGGIGPEERLRRVAQLKKSIAELGEFGKAVGVRYAFENLPSYHAIGSDVGELADILADVKAPFTGMCFDGGHANMVGDAAAAVRRAAGQVIYVHLSDNSGLEDDHGMPTYGTLDADALARSLFEIHYSGTMMLEVFYSTDRLRKLIDEGCGQRLARMVDIANGRAGEPGR
jgi:sugar phosphate isomerase/epimerase